MAKLVIDWGIWPLKRWNDSDMAATYGFTSRSWGVQLKDVYPTLSNYEGMLSHVDCKASFRWLQFLFATFLQLTSFWGPLRNSFLTHFFRMILEAKNAPTLNFATTKPSQPKTLLKCHRIQPAGFRPWNPLLGALLGAVWQRRRPSCSFERFPMESQTHLSHAVWNSRLLTPCCLLVLYLSGRVLQKLHDRLQIFMFLIGFSSCFWLSFGPLLHFLHRWLSAACWFALWFQLCGQAIVFLASSSTWHEWFWWILWCSCAERWSFF